ncbi:hypothetical protein [Leptothoe kymatousa]|uniref:Uncharacterized protein n=1 Tax=Leptothoe kymatousa TAU-MAC 1615 TaxID=2364775 RepID=A0ABS5Y2V7_9CYAN|nr:hypothetical protein [Leptothoe kymatousa]MBT9312150.1 hypothetical protein [Leptothoe kymatousa TAU-MAC 1615]
MAQLAPIQLEDGTIIYIEAEEAITPPPVPAPDGPPLSVHSQSRRVSWRTELQTTQNHHRV